MPHDMEVQWLVHVLANIHTQLV